MNKFVLNGEEWTMLELKDIRGREEEFLEQAWTGGVRTLRDEQGTRTWVGIFQPKMRASIGIILHDTASGESCMKEALNVALDHDIKEILG